MASRMAPDGGERPVGGSEAITGWMGGGVSLGCAFHPGSYGDDESGNGLLHDFRDSDVFHVATLPSDCVGGRTAGIVICRVNGRRMTRKISRRKRDSIWH